MFFVLLVPSKPREDYRMRVLTLHVCNVGGVGGAEEIKMLWGSGLGEVKFI